MRVPNHIFLEFLCFVWRQEVVVVSNQGVLGVVYRTPAKRIVSALWHLKATKTISDVLSSFLVFKASGNFLAWYKAL